MPRNGFDRRQHGALVGRLGLVDRERPDGDPPQPAQVGTATERGGRDRRRACARTCPTSIRHRSPARPGRRSALTSKRWTVTGRGTRSTSIALAGQLVQPAPLDTDRRDHRRHLLDVASQVLGDHGTGVVDRHPGHVVGGDDRAVGVERVRLHAEHDLARVALGTLADEAQQPSDRADADDEHARGTRVERAGVADAPLTEAAAQHADDVVAGHARPACRRSPRRGLSAVGAAPATCRRAGSRRCARRRGSPRRDGSRAPASSSPGSGG